MLTNFLFTILYSLLYLLATPLLSLSDVSLPQNIAAAITNAGSYIHILGFVLPVSTLLSVFGLFIAVEAAIFAFKLIMFVKNLIW